MSNLYETQELLTQYLLFHYGSGSDILPYDFGPKEGLYFPVRCISECVKIAGAKALDLGCAVGRSTFELSKYFNTVVGIDYSETFIDYANRIKNQKKLNFSIKEEGEVFREVEVTLPSDLNPERVSFFHADVQNLGEEFFSNDLVLAANLLCRLQKPKEFLELTKDLVRVGGQLVLISPYSWLSEYTDPQHWFSAKGSSEERIIEILSDSFILKFKKELPFLIREHSRKFQWGVSQALIFERRAS